MALAAHMLTEMEAASEVEKEKPEKVFRPQPRSAAASVHKEDDVFVIMAPALERIVAAADVTDAEIRRHLRRQLDRTGITRALGRAGIKPGDKVRLGDFEWDW